MRLLVLAAGLLSVISTSAMAQKATCDPDPGNAKSKIKQDDIPGPNRLHIAAGQFPKYAPQVEIEFDYVFSSAPIVVISKVLPGPDKSVETITSIENGKFTIDGELSHSEYCINWIAIGEIGRKPG
jgi:hypothetical protein